MLTAVGSSMAGEVMAAWSPPPRLTTTEWADRYRWLSTESAAEPGQYRSSRAPYQRGMQDALHEPGIRKVVYMTSSQVGKTTIVENVLGRMLHLEPCPIIIMLPTVDKGQEFSKERLSPMCRDTPALKDIFPPVKSRDSSNTILTKHARNGAHIAIVGANAPAGLASRPRRILLADEIDRMKKSAGTEGDPLEIARRRLANYFNSFELLTSTPGNQDTSLIAREFEASDKRYYHVPCQHCGEFIVLEYRNLRWETEDEVVIPESVEYRCQVCGMPMTRTAQPALLENGDWIPTAPTRDVAGFHLWTIYSPWTEWYEIAQKRHAAGRDPDLLKVFWNTYLGLPWEEKGETVDYQGLLDRREDYGALVPDPVLMLTAGVDTQDDRLEATVYGWGHGEECYAIAHYVIDGDPSAVGTRDHPNVWARLDEILFSADFTKADGSTLPVAATCIDSAGHRTSSVYKYARQRGAKRVYAVIGRGGEARPIIGSPTVVGKGAERTKLWTIGTFEAKGIIYSRLRIDEEGPGYIHFPSTPEFDEEFFKQLTAEIKVPVVKNGVQTVTWKLRQGRRRNETLDTAVYALAAMRRLRPNFDALEKRLVARTKSESPAKGDEGAKKKTKRTKARRRGGFVNKWKG